MNERPVALRGERGGAVPEFVLVTALLLILALGLVQVACYLYARNMAMDAASNGARVGALADATADDGARRAQALAADALGEGAVLAVSASEEPSEAGARVSVRVEVAVSLFGVVKGPTSVAAVATATRFS